MTFDEYCALPALNWSTLKAMSDSPAHFRFREMTPRTDNDTLTFGRAVHTAVLEPDRFPLDYAVFTGARRAGAAWTEFQEANEGRTILTASQYATCLSVRDAVHECKPARELLFMSARESVSEFVHESTGIDCKARADLVHRFDPDDPRRQIVDIKTTRSTDAREFMRSSANLLYHGQLAFYDMAFNGTEPPAIIAVEKEPPFDVAVFTLTDEALLVGRQLVDRLMEAVASCRKDDCWPGRYQDPQLLDVPDWMLPDDEDLTGWEAMA